MAMPIFSMNIFRLPKEICEEINAILARFWWGAGENKGLHWYAWKRICIPKKEGGLGFRDLETFNQALLGKQVWRILQNPHLLMSRVLRARYFPDGDILTATLKPKSSYAWKSILFGKELIVKGMRYIIGNGITASMWTDAWLDVHPPRPPTPRRQVNFDQKVSEYLNDNRTDWNFDKLREDVIEEDVQRITLLRVSSKAEQDLMGWHYNDNGIYTVKSGYWLANHLPASTTILPTYGTVTLKQQIWKTTIPAKLKHFLWRIVSRSIATGSNLRRRHITRDAICKRCWREEESEEHLFFNCSFAKKVWRSSGIANTIIDSATTSFVEKMEACLQVSNTPALQHLQDLPIWILWRLWKSRNLLLFQHRQQHWSYVSTNARSDAREWKNSNKDEEDNTMQDQTGMRMRNRQIWKPPPEQWLKCNVDASFNNMNELATAGWVIRDDQGHYKGAVEAKGFRVSTPLESELQAILMATQYCWRVGYRKVITESDCRKAIDILNGKCLHFPTYNWIREIRWWATKIQDVSYQWVGREANKVADALAKRNVSSLSSYNYYYYIPVSVTNLLHEDYVQTQTQV